MTKTYRGKSFRNRYDQDSAKVFEDLVFLDCSFLSCAVSMARTPQRRSIVRRVQLINCKAQGCAIEAAILEDVLVDGLRTGSLLQAWGAVFKHVTLRGKFDALMVSTLIATGTAPPERQSAFDLANREYYEGVDWALDIREAKFMEADLRGIPGRLIIRDPETQFLLTRERALNARWEQLDLAGTYWPISIEFFLKGKMDSEVLVAPKANPRFRQLLAGLWTLRDAGVVE